MKIGIVSDTHGRVDLLRLALDAFAGRGVQAVVHCGDIDSRACLEALAELGVPAYAVGGNMDTPDHDNPDAGLSSTAAAGVTFAWESLTFPTAEGFVAVTHGHLPDVFAKLVNNPANKFVLHGHTHSQRDEHFDRRGADPVHVINPGALSRPRHPTHPTVATLDTERHVVEFIDM